MTSYTWDYTYNCNRDVDTGELYQLVTFGHDPEGFSPGCTNEFVPLKDVETVVNKLLDMVPYVFVQRRNLKGKLVRVKKPFKVDPADNNVESEKLTIGGYFSMVKAADKKITLAHLKALRGG